MSENHIKFLKYEPQSFAGIHKDMKLVVFFPENEKIIAFEGDQGTTKTSNLACLKMLMGAEEVANAVNKTDNDKKASLTLQKGESTYEVKCTKTGFSVTLVQEVNGKPVKSSVSQPKTFLQQLIGPIASNPMPLKEMDGPKQINWIRNIFPLSTEEQVAEKQAKEKFEYHYKVRTDVNREIKNRKQELLSTGYYVWDDDNKTLIESDLMRADTNLIQANDLDAINSMMKDAAQKVAFYNAGMERLSQLRNVRESKSQQLENLKKSIALLESEIAETEEAIKKGEDYVKERENAAQEWAQAQEKASLLQEISAKKERIFYVSKKRQEFDGYEQRHIEVESTMDEATATIKEIIRKSTPEIDGLEVVLQTGIDSMDSRSEGIYYKGHSMQELCESELWDMYMQVCDKSGVKVIMIENVQNLGSDAIARINQLASNGATVFASIMDRNQKNYTVSFYNQLK